MVEDTCFQCETWWMDDKLTRNGDMMRWEGVGVAGWLCYESGKIEYNLLK